MTALSGVTPPQIGNWERFNRECTATKLHEIGS